MSTEFNLSEIKKRANAAALQDGLMEVFMGLFLVFRFCHLFRQPSDRKDQGALYLPTHRIRQAPS